MQIYVLGGNSTHNQPWAHSLGDALAGLAERVEVHDYAHWQDKKPSIDLDHELSQVAAELQTIPDYMFVAKSIGTVLVAKGIHTNRFAPKACVLLGVPLGMIEREAVPFAEWLKAAGCPLVFIQNHADPVGSFEELQAYLQRHGLGESAQLELPGETHDYANLSAIRQTVAGHIT